MTVSPRAADAPVDSSTASYVYGIVPSGTQLPEELQGVGDRPGPVHALPCGDVAALVSECATDRALGTRKDLLAHEKVLDTMALRAPTLPMRFGAVLDDAEAVVEDLLAAHHEHFADVLAELHGHVQFTVKGRYVEESVLSEVLAEDPDIMALRERTQQLPADASYYDRIRLGELVVQALAGKRAADGQLLLDTLARYATATHVHDPGDEQEMGNAAFLVPTGKQEEFEDAVEDLARQWDGRTRLRLLGPLAPYDFVEAEQDG